MSNLIIIAIILVMVVYGAMATMKHFKGRAAAAVAAVQNSVKIRNWMDRRSVKKL